MLSASRHHRKQFALRMERAQKALLGGKASTLAYSLGVGEADVERVGSVSSASAASKAKPKEHVSKPLPTK
jgi:hypothetical protein